MDKKTLILSAYEKLKMEIDEDTIRENDKIWEEYLELAKSWPQNKEPLIEEAASRQMNNIAGIGQGESLRKNFKHFILNDITDEHSKKPYLTIRSMYRMDVVDFLIKVNRLNIEEIIYLAIQCSLKKKNKVFESLLYIDVLYRVLFDRMWYYPHYPQGDRPVALLIRFFNLLYGHVFTTIGNNNKFNSIAESLGISSKESYVYKQMHIRKMVNECLDVYNPKENSQYVRAATAWWINNV